MIRVAVPEDSLFHHFGFSVAASAIPTAFSTRGRVLSGGAFTGSASPKRRPRLARLASSQAPAANNPVNRTAGNTHRSRQAPCPAAGYLPR